VVYSEGVKRNAKLVSVAEPSAEETMYQSAFSVLLNQTLAKTGPNLEKLGGAPFFEKAVLRANTPERKTSGAKDMGENERETEATETSKRKSSFAGMEEIKDEDERKWKAKPKSEFNLLEEIEDEQASGMENEKDEAEKFWFNEGKIFIGDPEERTGEVFDKEGLWTTRKDENETLDSDTNRTSLPSPALPSRDETIRLYKKRKAKAGRSAMGTSILSMKGRVGDRDGALIDIRLDTCADITLISEEFYKEIKNAPPIRQGIPVKLLQLTQEETGIEGFTTIPLYIASEEGLELEMEAEAYVVPGMSVPILLGEDFQLTYELALTRNVESGTKIHFQDWDYTVKAQNVRRTPDFS
jgi:hypothetical protein